MRRRHQLQTRTHRERPHPLPLLRRRKILQVCVTNHESGGRCALVKRKKIIEHCGLCACKLHRGEGYAKPTLEGRSHATEHHFVAERFFGRSRNRRGTVYPAIFPECPWNCERKKLVFCYECHELLLHNPVFLPEDMALFRDLVRNRGLAEEDKPENGEKIAGRIRLFHEVIARGLQELTAGSIER